MVEGIAEPAVTYVRLALPDSLRLALASARPLDHQQTARYEMRVDRGMS